MKQQTKQWLAIGAGVVVLYLLLKPKKVTTASSAEDKMKLADQPADAELRKSCEKEVKRNARPTVVQSDEKWAIYDENQIAACIERRKKASTIAAAAGVDVDSQLFQKGGLSMKNYVDVNSNSFFQTVSTRDPRDIKV